MLVAGEASGDAHTAELVRALREKAPEIDFEFFGATGAEMRRAGVETVLSADNFSIVGLPEITRALPMFWNAFKTLKRAARERKPEAVVLTDFPDFNLKLARSLKKSGLKTIYYISPQLWAWRKYRARTIKRYVDLLLAILPFEKDWYARRGIDHVRFVGNPLAGRVRAQTTREEFCARRDLDPEKPIVALLPGSRHKEIVRILPVMLETAAAMSEKLPELQFVVALASEPARTDAETALRRAVERGLRLPEKLLVAAGETREALAAAAAAAVTSGTATLEAAMIGVPMAIVYKTSAFNYGALRPLIDVPHFGLINLIAQERVAAELIQSDFTAEKLSAELFRLLQPDANRRMREQLKRTVETLGAGGASERAAEEILRFLNRI
jgi:lipid-A-disaccharide synthase